MTPMVRARAVEIPQDDGSAALHGDLVLPEGAGALIVFAHGSGSSRHSPRNRQVAELLQRDGLGTLLLDLLTEPEEAADRRTGHLRFDIDLLAGRLIGTVTWLDQQAELAPLRIGYFGASTGAAAALVAATRQPDRIGAIVSRGGRPDLAAAALPAVRAPTLLLVGGRDETVLALNQQAHEQMRCERRLTIVPGATHLFQEPGALDQVATLAADWFATHLVDMAANGRTVRS
jgi:putative phosphoribosyl transferase